MAELYDSKFVSEAHNYERNTQSGSNECVLCGEGLQSPKHPHLFLMTTSPMVCVCGLGRRALMHQMTRM